MRPVDIGIDAARMLARPRRRDGCARSSPERSTCRSPAACSRCATTEAPRGPLHLRVASPARRRGRAARSWVDGTVLRIGDHGYRLDAPVWSPQLPPASSLTARAPAGAATGCPDLGPDARPRSGGARDCQATPRRALRRGDLLTFAARSAAADPGSPRPGTTCWPACCWSLARSATGRGRLPGRTLQRECRATGRTTSHARSSPAPPEAAASSPPTRCCTALASADRARQQSAADHLRRFGSSSGAALTYGIRTALLELPPTPRLMTRSVTVAYDYSER